jgi:hypothetical protein
MAIRYAFDEEMKMIKTIMKIKAILIATKRIIVRIV